MPPESIDDFEAADVFTPWNAWAAAIWIGLVSLVWFAAIVAERGERIRRIVESVMNRL